MKIIKYISAFIFALSIWRNGEKENNPYYLTWDTAWEVACILRGLKV